ACRRNSGRKGRSSRKRSRRSASLKSAPSAKSNTLPRTRPNRTKPSNAATAKSASCARKSTPCKEQIEKALREQLRKEQAQREAGAAAAREAEQRYGGEIHDLRNRLGEREDVLKSRNEEIQALKTQVASLAEQLSKVGTAKERAASLLQQKLQAEKRGEQAKDSALRELEAGFNARIEELRAELAAREEAVGSRDAE